MHFQFSYHKILLERANGVYNKALRQQQQDYFDLPSALAGEDAAVKLSPRVGKHRPDQDAVFSVVRGLPAVILARFVESLLNTGYDGDIVLGVLPWNDEDMTQDARDYLTFHAEHSNLVAYEIDIKCRNYGFKSACKVPRMFVNRKTDEYIADPRDYRQIAQLRFEYYWVWSRIYQAPSRIFLFDGRDVYFQLNPFDYLPSSLEGTLHVFQETLRNPIKDQSSNRRWILNSRGNEVLREIGDKPVVCSGSTVGGQGAIGSYLCAMVQSFDETQCMDYGCDQGHHNYLLHTGRLLRSPAVRHVECNPQGEGIVNTIGQFARHYRPIRKHGILQNGTNLVLNTDGTVSAVVHQFDRDRELRAIMDKRAEELFAKWNTTVVEVGGSVDGGTAHRKK